MHTRKFFFCVAALVAACWMGSLRLPAQEQAKVEPVAVVPVDLGRPASFTKDVLPILEEKCQACHSSALVESKLLLEEHAQILKGGKRGPAVVPGKSADSLMIKAAGRTAQPVMPPPAKKNYAPLTPKELGILKLWIDQGAKDDGEGGPKKPRVVQWIGLPSTVNQIVALSMSPNGQLVAAGRGNFVQVYDVGSGSEVVSLAGHQDIVQSLRFSPDGTLVAAGGFQTVKTWRAPEDKELLQYRDPTSQRGIVAHGDQVPGMALSPDGKLLATAGFDGRLQLWDAAAGNLVRTLGSNLGQLFCVTFSSDEIGRAHV